MHILIRKGLKGLSYSMFLTSVAHEVDESVWQAQQVMSFPHSQVNSGCNQKPPNHVDGVENSPPDHSDSKRHRIKEQDSTTLGQSPLKLINPYLWTLSAGGNMMRFKLCSRAGKTLQLWDPCSRNTFIIHNGIFVQHTAHSEMPFCTPWL